MLTKFLQLSDILMICRAVVPRQCFLLGQVVVGIKIHLVGIMVMRL